MQKIQIQKKQKNNKNRKKKRTRREKNPKPLIEKNLFTDYINKEISQNPQFTIKNEEKKCRKQPVQHWCLL